jgi:hypothetical protein
MTFSLWPPSIGPLFLLHRLIVEQPDDFFKGAGFALAVVIVQLTALEERI